MVPDCVAVDAEAFGDLERGIAALVRVEQIHSFFVCEAPLTFPSMGSRALMTRLLGCLHLVQIRTVSPRGPRL